MINRSDIYDKNLNFLIGSGASAGLLPTLALQMKKSGTGSRHTLETVATEFEEDHAVMCLLFSYYVEKVIKPAASFNPNFNTLNSQQKKCFANYAKFLITILSLISRKGHTKRANIFTTNYDGMIAHCAEKMIQGGKYDFILNDGASGFVRKTLQARNFNRFVKDQGAFDRHEVSVPQINLIQPHGSVYWYRSDDSIEVSYDLKRSSDRIASVPVKSNSELLDILGDESKDETDIDPELFSLPQEEIDKFWLGYKKLPIVNPTKWKFHETVFEEHYYQALRALSYELESQTLYSLFLGSPSPMNIYLAL